MMLPLSGWDQFWWDPQALQICPTVGAGAEQVGKLRRQESVSQLPHEGLQNAHQA